MTEANQPGTTGSTPTGTQRIVKPDVSTKTVLVTLAIVFVFSVGCGFAVWAAASFAGGQPGYTSLADNETGGDNGGPEAPAANAADVSSVVDPGQDVDWSTVAYPGMDCGPFPVQVLGSPIVMGGDDIVRVSCKAGAGTPPDALFAYSVKGGVPQLVTVLLPASQDMVAGQLTVSGPVLTAQLSGWSSPDVTQADPDVHRAAHWTEAADGTFTPTA